jgi:hypothetical protein
MLPCSTALATTLAQVPVVSEHFPLKEKAK